MIKKITIPCIIMAFILTVVSILLFFSSNPDNSDGLYQQAFVNNYKIFTPVLPHKIDFSGEELPLDRFYVREALDKELVINVYWQSHTILLLKRANRLFPVIEPILKKYGIPDDFKYLAMVESDLENRVSPAGATGVWQFMKEAGTRYGLEINDCVDERYNLEKATEAACRYLKDSYDMYADWTLVAASYNLGKTGVSDRIKMQKAKTYYEMALPEETSRYIYRIVAMKHICTHPVQYGFYLRKKDVYPPLPTHEIVIDSAVSDLADFARQYNMDYKILKEFNPWLRVSYLINKNKKSYVIKLPQDGIVSYDRLMKEVKDQDMILGDTIRVNKLK